MKYRWVKWRDDKWFSTSGTVLPYDKAEHAVISAALVVGFMFFMPVIAACVLSLILGSLWEVKDGYMNYKVYGWWGGEGFSWKDLIADSFGIGFVFVLKLFL